jgi:hypothetical protein
MKQKISLEEMVLLRKKHHLNGRAISVALINDVVEAKKGKILSDNWSFKSAKDKLTIRCSNGHVFETSWAVLKNNSWCRECSFLEASIRNRLDPAIVRTFLEQKGLGSLDNDWCYTNSAELFWVTCKNRHRWQTNWNKLYYENHSCQECKRLEKEKKVLDFLKGKSAALANPKWHYVNNFQNIPINCVCGHFFEKSWADIKIWCPECNEKDRKLKKELNVKKVVLAKNGYLEENWHYLGTNVKFSVKCQKGHMFKTNWNTLNMGSWCPACSKFKRENEFRCFIENFFGRSFSKQTPDWLNNGWQRKKPGKRLELDGYNEELRIAFEFQGQQHYKEVPFFKCTGHNYVMVKVRDKFKVQRCLDNGVKLLIVPYWLSNDEWKNLINENVGSSLAAI